jgi:hypothetical protein
MASESPWVSYLWSWDWLQFVRLPVMIGSDNSLANFNHQPQLTRSAQPHILMYWFYPYVISTPLPFIWRVTNVNFQKDRFLPQNGIFKPRVSSMPPLDCLWCQEFPQEKGLFGLWQSCHLMWFEHVCFNQPSRHWAFTFFILLLLPTSVGQKTLFASKPCVDQFFVWLIHQFINWWEESQFCQHNYLPHGGWSQILHCLHQCV